jgi:hypothetical protein
MNLSTLPAKGRPAERRLDFAVEAARPAHLPEIAAIYAEQVAAGLGSFEDSLPDAMEMGRRLDAVQAAGLPAYVAVDAAGGVLGCCWARPFRSIAAYHATVEDCVHVAGDARRHGVGRAAGGADRSLRPARLPRDDRRGRRCPQPGLDRAARTARVQGSGLPARCGAEAGLGSGRGAAAAIVAGTRVAAAELKAIAGPPGGGEAMPRTSWPCSGVPTSRSRSCSRGASRALTGARAAIR